MERFERSDLKFAYKWAIDEINCARFHGQLDSTLFDRSEGYEILYLINNITENIRFTDRKSAGNWIEDIIKDLPPRSLTQAEVKTIIIHRLNV